MPVFISWSGDRSKGVAEALRRFLPLVIQRLPVFMSGSDIAAGTKWANILHEQLAKATFGIICVTPENLQMPWLNFEAGAISNAVGQPRVAPLLLELHASDVGPPLSLFEMSEFTRQDIYSLVVSINETEQALRLDTPVLDEAFAAFWPRLEADLAALAKATDATPGKKTGREESDILREILSLLRSQGGESSTARLPRRAAPQGYNYIPLWDAMEARATRAGLSWDFTPELSEADIVADTIAIETQFVQAPPSEPVLNGWIGKIRRTISGKNLEAGILVVTSQKPMVDVLKSEALRVPEKIGIVLHADNKFIGTPVAREIAPWLVDETLPGSA